MEHVGALGVGNNLHADNRNSSEKEAHAEHNEAVGPQALRSSGLVFGRNANAVHACLEAILEGGEVADRVEDDSDVAVLVEVDEEAAQKHEGDDEDGHQRHGCFEFWD